MIPNKFPAVLLLAVFALFGCVAPKLELPEKQGTITTQFSEYDGVTRYEMKPLSLWNYKVEDFDLATWSAPSMSLGLRYAEGDDVVLIKAVVLGITTVRYLGFNIDGEVVELQPIGGATGTETHIRAMTFSDAMFEASPELIRRILGGGNVLVRLQTRHGFVDEDFSAQCGKSDDIVMTACDGFAKFMSEVVDKKGESE